MIASFRNFRPRSRARRRDFRNTFPGFVSPLPIYLYHSLGVRDGGSDILQPGHRQVMFFGADMIAELHADNSLQPFLDHELFHLEHARSFPDCDQFWCAMWQEGLAVSAAAAMTPHASDHQLLLDTPTAIRPPTDVHWTEALCYVSSHFDDTSSKALAGALTMGSTPPTGLPSRFGYYVGYRIAEATHQPVTSLARLGNKAARPIVRRALVRLMIEARSTCAAPATDATVTHAAHHCRGRRKRAGARAASGRRAIASRSPARRHSRSDGIGGGRRHGGEPHTGYAAGAHSRAGQSRARDRRAATAIRACRRRGVGDGRRTGDRRASGGRGTAAVPAPPGCCAGGLRCAFHRGPPAYSVRERRRRLVGRRAVR